MADFPTRLIWTPGRTISWSETPIEGVGSAIADSQATAGGADLNAGQGTRSVSPFAPNTPGLRIGERSFTETPREFGGHESIRPAARLPWNWPGRSRFYRETIPRIETGFGTAVADSNANGIGTEQNAGQGTALADSDASAVGAAIFSSIGQAIADSTAELTDWNVASAVGTATANSSATGTGACARGVIGVDIFTYRPPDATIIGPGGAAFRPRREPQLMVQAAQNDAPNFFEYETDSAAPLTGQKLIAEIAGTTYFEGPIVRVDQTYEGQRQQPIWHVTSQDYTFFLNRRRPFGCYTNESATDVVTDLMTRFTSGLTFDVEVDLPVISIELDGTRDFSNVLTDIAVLVGGHWRFEGTALKFFRTETGPTPDAINDVNTSLLRDPQVRISEDLTQIRTRVFGRGAGAKVSATVPAGSTEIQVEGLDLFPGTGGQAFSHCQVLRYGAKASVTSKVDRGTAPADGSGNVSARLLNDSGQNYQMYILQDFSGGGLAHENGGLKGTAAYYVAFVRAGKGESEITSLGSVGSFSAQPFTGFASSSKGFSGITAAIGSGAIESSATGDYFFMWRAHGTLTFQDAGDNNLRIEGFGSGGHNVTFNNLPITGFPHISGFDVFRRKSDSRGDFYYHVGSVSNGQTSFTDNAPEANLKSPLLDPETGLPMDAGFVRGSGLFKFQHGIQAKIVVPLGDADTTARKIYRAESASIISSTLGSPTLLTTIPDNETTIYFDSKAIAGGVGTAPPADVFITRYFLTGIPTSGAGSIEHEIPAGETIHLWVQEDDLAAQVDLAAREGGDGVHEYTVVDESLTTEASLRLRCQVELQVFARPIKTVIYATRDTKTKVGRTVTFALSNPAISGSFKIVDVKVDQIHMADTLVERYTATASSAKFTLDDLLRRVLLR